MRKTALAIAAAFAFMLSGCLSDPAPPKSNDEPVPAAEPTDAVAVVALIDTGINPYHIDFRDNSSLAFVHPSEYLPGYPGDVAALRLNFTESSFAAARDKDKAVWDSVKPNTLYWIPGTKIVGAYTTGGRIVDSGHGTMTASRAAGNQYSLCPECRIAAVQGFNAKAVSWASQQPWIDAQSNSWSPLVVFQQADGAQESGLAKAFEDAAKRHAVFGSAGNGAMGKGGVAGHPSFTRSTSGPRGVMAIGGHDNGEVILWSGSWPHVVADACNNWAAVGSSVDRYSGSAGGGTSSASPYAAGEAARLVLEARRILGDDGTVGVKDGVFARAGPDAAKPTKGPLADGDLKLSELQQVMMKTAVARPVKTLHDGDNCGATGTPYTTYPVAWKDVPANVPAYYLIGYGQISVQSVAKAVDVLSGATDMPSRPADDEWHARAEMLRNAYNSLPRT